MITQQPGSVKKLSTRVQELGAKGADTDSDDDDKPSIKQGSVMTISDSSDTGLDPRFLEEDTVHKPQQMYKIIPLCRCQSLQESRWWCIHGCPMRWLQ